jgi:hypothetical protein
MKLSTSSSSPLAEHAGDTKQHWLLLIHFPVSSLTDWCFVSIRQPTVKSCLKGDKITISRLKFHPYHTPPHHCPFCYRSLDNTFCLQHRWISQYVMVELCFGSQNWALVIIFVHHLSTGLWYSVPWHPQVRLSPFFFNLAPRSNYAMLFTALSRHWRKRTVI